ncbi:MAG: hypothetical protein IRZ24_16895, partial [Thermogemmatispora sp.]
LGTLPVRAAAGTAVVTPPTTATATSPAASSCLAAAPAKQQVAVGQPAFIVITVSCYPSVPLPVVIVNWGDGNLSKYPLCKDACPAPPVELIASHSYAKVGTYLPVICLQSGTGPITPQPECVSVEVVVVPPTVQPQS